MQKTSINKGMNDFLDEVMVQYPSKQAKIQKIKDNQKDLNKRTDASFWRAFAVDWVGYIMQNKNKMWSWYLGKEPKKKADEKWIVEVFITSFNKNNSDDFEIVEDRESPDFLLKNSKGHIWALELTAVAGNDIEGKIFIDSTKCLEIIQEKINNKNKEEKYVNSDPQAEKVLLIDFDKARWVIDWETLLNDAEKKVFDCSGKIISRCFIAIPSPIKTPYLELKTL